MVFTSAKGVSQTKLFNSRQITIYVSWFTAWPSLSKRVKTGSAILHSSARLEDIDLPFVKGN